MKKLFVVAVIGVSFACSTQQTVVPSTASTSPTTSTPVASVTVPEAPTARTEPFAETIHGIEISDPYRWMEKSSDELTQWIDAQDRRARAVLSSLPDRDAIRADIEKADRGAARVQLVSVTGDPAHPRLFISRRSPDDPLIKLYVRDGWNGEDRLLVDPVARATADTHYSLDYIYPSNDGRYVAYGISASGSEDSTIEILDVDTGRILPEKIDRSQYASISWRPDNRSFFYWRRAKPLPGATRADWFMNSASYLHRIGDDAEKDRALIGGAMKELGIAPESFSFIQSYDTSNWVLGVATPGTSADLEYFIARASDVASSKPFKWRRLSTNKDHIRGMLLHGDTVYAISYDHAPRYKVISFDAKNGTLATANNVVPAGTHVIEDAVPARDALYVQWQERGLSRVTRIPWNGGAREDLKLPFDGSIVGLSDRKDGDGVIFSMTGWTKQTRPWVYSPAEGVRDPALVEPWPIDYSDLAVQEVEVRSEDGTMVPMSIVAPSGLSKDGSRAALLEGYAAYGVSQSPYFSPINLVWAKRGNVYAECHARGGGAYGEEWHLAGSKLNKERGIEDVIACAEYLVAQRYTSPQHLSVTGTSAGGVLAGGTVTRRPDLFTAALLRVPMVNLTRFETTEGGPANVPEFGSTKDANEFRAMYSSDPYYRIKSGTRYPAMVVTGGLHDVRVPVWIPAKFVAKMQSEDRGAPILFRVEREAGHGIGSTRAQVRDEWADLYAFALWRSTASR